MMDLLSVGHAAYDLTMSVDSHPAADEKLQATAMQGIGGGPAANAAVQVTRLGGSAAFCGYLGHDLYGDAHVAELDAEGVDCSCLVRGQHPSPVSQILAKPDGCRSVVNFKGNTPWLATDTIDISGLHPRVILFDGHEPLISEKLIDRAIEQGIPTILDAGSVHRGTEALAMSVTYLVASSGFARQFCATDDMQVALEQLSGKRDNVVITMGDQGLLWAKDGKSGSLDAFKVNAIDSTGAGDAFHGAFAFGIARGMGWHELLRFASAAGALTCTRLGARAGLPIAPEVAALMNGSDQAILETSLALFPPDIKSEQ